MTKIGSLAEPKGGGRRGSPAFGGHSNRRFLYQCKVDNFISFAISGPKK
jgi:hypothetical protein